ncbi:MAG: glycine betaine/L-proline ABC transporter ATP-binding protein ProV [Alphaproteobacteria bacterium]
MSEAEQPKIILKNITKIFSKSTKSALKYLSEGATKQEVLEKTGKHVGVYDASLEIYPGEIFVIMGLSGSGKSTLLRMLNLLIRPTSGDVIIDGMNITQLEAKDLREVRKKKMAMVFQSFALLPHLSVIENVAFGLNIAGVSKKEAQTKAMEALEQVGLEQYAQSKPQSLSGGQQQRVGLARALAVDPEILLMDEAFSALDPLIRTEMQDELIRLQDEQRRTIVFISHDLDEAMRIGDRIAIMEGGCVKQVGTSEEILKNPADDYVRSFFKGVNTTNVFSAGDVASKTQVTVIRRLSYGPRTALQRLVQYDRSYGIILDAKGHYLGMVATDKLQRLIKKEDKTGRPATFQEAFVDDIEPILDDTSLQDVLPVITEHQCPIPVVNSDNIYQGAITKNLFLEALNWDNEDIGEIA